MMTPLWKGSITVVQRGSSWVKHLTFCWEIIIWHISFISSVRVSVRFRPVDSKVVPALGMAWANQVMVRLMVTRLPGAVSMGTQSSARRRLEVVFAPHLARDSCLFGVWREGTRGLPSPPTQDTSSWPQPNSVDHSPLTYRRPSCPHGSALSAHQMYCVELMII